jgi:hypothetical protein
VLRIVFQDGGVEQDLSNLIKTDIFFHHLLMAVYRDSYRVSFGLLPEASGNRFMVVDIEFDHYRRVKTASLHLSDVRQLLKQLSPSGRPKTQSSL